MGRVAARGPEIEMRFSGFHMETEFYSQSSRVDVVSKNTCLGLDMSTVKF